MLPDTEYWKIAEQLQAISEAIHLLNKEGDESIYDIAKEIEYLADELARN